MMRLDRDPGSIPWHMDGRGGLLSLYPGCPHLYRLQMHFVETMVAFVGILYCGILELCCVSGRCITPIESTLHLPKA